VKYASDLPDFVYLLRAAADWKKQRAAIVEKDYHLTRALQSLCEGHAGEFILKGGTSLSKGWNLLDRFSEDLDILVRSDAKWGAAKRDRRLKALRDTIANTKGLTLDSEDKRTRSETGVSRTAVYRYESITRDVPGLGRNVLFEAGYRGSADAAVKKPIQSIIAEYAAAQGQSDLAEDLHAFDLELQDVRRTFVEKGFAIHAAYSKDFCNNRMRHYYDLSRLCRLEEVISYVGTEAYRQCVIDVKKICLESFPDQAVPDGSSLSNCPAFTATEETFSILEGNYKKEAEIFFSEPPSLKSIFDDIDKVLPKL
jgi:predicted nucleotidyltransferase component of viral defense system